LSNEFGNRDAVLLRDVGKCEVLGVPLLYLAHPFNNFSAAKG